MASGVPALIVGAGVAGGIVAVSGGIVYYLYLKSKSKG